MSSQLPNNKPSRSDMNNDDISLIKITVKSLSGDSYMIEVSPTDTILAIKEKIEHLKQIPPAQQRIVSCGKQLEDDKTVQECGIVDECTLMLVLKLS